MEPGGAERLPNTSSVANAHVTQVYYKKLFNLYDVLTTIVFTILRFYVLWIYN